MVARNRRSCRPTKPAVKSSRYSRTPRGTRSRRRQAPRHRVRSCAGRRLEDGRRFKANALFDDVAGNVLIGRSHGAEMWGLSVEQRAEVLTLLKTKR